VQTGEVKFTGEKDLYLTIRVHSDAYYIGTEFTTYSCLAQSALSGDFTDIDLDWDP
jgi:hypothetical protein